VERMVCEACVFSEFVDVSQWDGGAIRVFSIMRSKRCRAWISRVNNKHTIGSACTKKWCIILDGVRYGLGFLIVVYPTLSLLLVCVDSPRGDSAEGCGTLFS